MHKIQAVVLEQLVGYIQDKIGDEPEVNVTEDSAGGLELRIRCKIGRDYPGMRPEDDAE